MYSVTSLLFLLDHIYIHSFMYNDELRTSVKSLIDLNNVFVNVLV